jgi:catechol 2,3-dioxygenase-like lactoylglutathione lyase family enzyme
MASNNNLASYYMKIRHVNHIGINVTDLEAARIFFTDLGFSVMGESEMKGELLDEVTGLNDAYTKLIMLEAPDKQLCLEIVNYYQPVDSGDSHPSRPNALGLNHLTFEVEGLDGIVKTLQQKGYDLVGSVQNYQNVWKLCYIYGPEGIIIELAEQL